MVPAPEQWWSQSYPATEQGFDLFFSDFYPMLLRRTVGLAALLDDDTNTTAEDLAQETLIKASRKWSDIDRSRRSLWAWLVTTSKNEYLHLLRERRNIHYTGLADTDIPDPTEAVSSVVVQIDILRLISQLPTGQRKVLELTLEGFRPKEIAEILGSSQGAIRSNLNRARNALAAKWQEFAQRDEEGERAHDRA